MMLWGADDFARARMRLGELPEARIASERARLNALGGLVETVECRRALLLRQFGENPQIGRAHVCTHVTNAHLVFSLLLEQKINISYKIPYISCYLYTSLHN